MKELTQNQTAMVAGGVQNAGDVDTCANTMMAAGGILAIAGALIGGAIGSIVPIVGTAVGASIGTGLGALAGGAYVAANGEACQGSSGEGS